MQSGWEPPLQHQFGRDEMVIKLLFQVYSVANSWHLMAITERKITPHKHNAQIQYIGCNDSGVLRDVGVPSYLVR